MSKRRRAELLRAVASQSTLGSDVSQDVSNMHANQGDHLIVEGKKSAALSERRDRRGTRSRRRPPYVVRWTDGHEGLTYPGPDAHVLPEKWHPTTTCRRPAGRDRPNRYKRNDLARVCVSPSPHGSAAS